MISLEPRKLSSSKYKTTNSQILPPPEHVAIIMDGNGRWAAERSRPRIHGHVKGTTIIKPIVRTATDLGIKVLTLWAFSTDNWKRPTEEVSFLMHLLERYIKKEKKHLMENNIKLTATGQLQYAPESVEKAIKKTVELTEKNTGIILNIAFSYGGREELIEAIKDIVRDARAGNLEPDDIDACVIKKHLFTATLPDPDLIIRTSGEQRLSNFLIWQSAYSELYFSPAYWPDFTPNHLREAIQSYRERERRYGLTGTQQKKGQTE